MYFKFNLVFLVAMATASPAAALSLNSFRAEHKLPPLATSALLAGAAYSHAHDLARRKTLDHKGFKERVMSVVSGAGAENVLFMTCAAGRKTGTHFCWPRLRLRRRGLRHRPVGEVAGTLFIGPYRAGPTWGRNMLLKGISAYGIASAKGDDGRHYWVLVLGN